MRVIQDHRARPNGLAGGESASDESASGESASAVAERLLVSEGAQYALVEIAQQAIALLALPVLLYFLTFDEFGVVTAAVVAAQIALSFGSAGLDLSVMRLYLRWTDGESVSRVAGILALTCAWSAALAATAWFMPWPRALEPRVPLVIGCWAGLLLAIRSIPLAVLRVRGSLGGYAVVMVGGSIAQAVAEVGLVGLGFGAAGYMAGYALGAGLSTVLAIALVRDRLVAQPHEWCVPSDVRSFALNVWPSVLGNRLLLVADRIVLAGAGSLDTLGVYGAASRLTTPVKLLSGGFKLALSPALSRGEAQRVRQDLLLLRLGHFIVIGMLFVGALLALCVWFAHLTPWAERSVELQRIVGLLLLAQFLSGLAFLGQVSFYYSANPRRATVVAFVSAAALVVGLATLVRSWGGTGAAIAQVASGVCGFLAVAVLSARDPGATAPWGRLLVATSSFVPCLLSVWLLGLPGQLLVVSATLVAYGVSMLVLARRLWTGQPVARFAS
jgi:O-antigen/teichoic acid export membrane protein